MIYHLPRSSLVTTDSPRVATIRACVYTGDISVEEDPDSSILLPEAEGFGLRASGLTTRLGEASVSQSSTPHVPHRPAGKKRSI